ncbi:MFS transporter [Dactylosporangium sp. McL0621]|uniref:MFS transporter n=1 Tax=Dactylosporangium sp. McL0621 TaxID=3415678 RepID=UPI003CFAE375
MRTLWRVLTRYRDLRLLLSAGLLSLIGDWVLRTGLAYHVYALTGSTLASATTLLASLLPQIAFGPLAGVYADRWDRRRTMIVTNLLLAAGLLPLLAVHSRDQVWIVYLVTVAQGSLAQFFITAEAAMMPRTVPSPELVTANALNGQNRDIARLAGAALGGLAAGLGGITALTLIDMASFAVAAAILALIRHRPGPASRPAPAPAHHAIRELTRGARIATHHPALRLLLLFVLITGAGEAVMGTLMAPFVRDILHGDAGIYGLILSSQAAGGIIGGIAVAAAGSRFSPRHLLGYGALAFGGLDLVLFLYPLRTQALWPAFAIMIAVGLPGALTVTGLFTLLQTTTDDAHRGRIFGLANAIQGAAMLAGTLAAGALGDRLGIIPVIAVQGVGYCAAGALMLLFLTRATSPTPQPSTNARMTIASRTTRTSDGMKA